MEGTYSVIRMRKPLTIIKKIIPKSLTQHCHLGKKCSLPKL